MLMDMHAVKQCSKVVECVFQIGLQFTKLSLKFSIALSSRIGRVIATFLDFYHVRQKNCTILFVQ